MVLEASYPRSRCWQGCFLLRTPSLACGSFDLYLQGHQSCWIRVHSKDFINLVVTLKTIITNEVNGYWINVMKEKSTKI